jgi:hypothetical protein
MEGFLRFRNKDEYFLCSSKIVSNASTVVLLLSSLPPKSAQAQHGEEDKKVVCWTRSGAGRRGSDVSTYPTFSPPVMSYLGFRVSSSIPRQWLL